VSVAVFGERGMHLPMLFLREFLDFALRLRRVARRWLSVEEARERVYGVFEQQVPYFFTLRFFNRDLRALLDTGTTCSTLSKCAFDALHLMDDVYARCVRELVQVQVFDTLNGRITPISLLQAQGSVHIGDTAATLSLLVQFCIV
jgi:hypothetical protein